MLIMAFSLAEALSSRGTMPPGGFRAQSSIFSADTQSETIARIAVRAFDAAIAPE
jgi:hypothetical protein